MAGKKTAGAKMGRPKGSSKEDTLARLMPEARRQFADKGYAQTTFKDIGKALGVSHAALYSYFPAKKELYLATVADAQALLLPYYLEALEAGGSLKSRISHILLATAREHDRDSSITGLLAAVPIEIRRHPELYEALIDENNVLMRALEDIFEQAKRSGEIAVDASAQDLVAALLGGGVGVALFQYGLQRPDLSATMAVFVALIEGRLFSRNGS
ncbi:MAG TPA: TetR/AcrR family transcriptional regulator [Pseudomonadales bacterium]